MKPFLIVLGFVAAALLIAQLAMGLLIANTHDPRWITRHQHSGYLTVVLALAYILISLIAVASKPKRESR